MERRESGEPLQPDPSSGMIRLMVVLARPESKELSNYDRAQKYRILRDNAARRMEDLSTWLKKQGLADQVASIGEPTAFNVLFVTASAEVAKRLVEAPGVVSVSPAEGFTIDQPKPAKKGPLITPDDL